MPVSKHTTHTHRHTRSLGRLHQGQGGWSADKQSLILSLKRSAETACMCVCICLCISASPSVRLNVYLCGVWFWCMWSCSLPVCLGQIMRDGRLERLTKAGGWTWNQCMTDKLTAGEAMLWLLVEKNKSIRLEILSTCEIEHAYHSTVTCFV